MDEDADPNAAATPSSTSRKVGGTLRVRRSARHSVRLRTMRGAQSAKGGTSRPSVFDLFGGPNAAAAATATAK